MDQCNSEAIVRQLRERVTKLEDKVVQLIADYNYRTDQLNREVRAREKAEAKTNLTDEYLIERYVKPYVKANIKHVDEWLASDV